MDNFMQQWISLLLDSFSSVFSTLDSFTFFGITLLDFIIACFVLSVAVPIVIATANGYINSSTVSDTARGAKIVAKAKTGKALDKSLSKVDNMLDDLKDY